MTSIKNQPRGIFFAIIGLGLMDIERLRDCIRYSTLSIDNIYLSEFYKKHQPNNTFLTFIWYFLSVYILNFIRIGIFCAELFIVIVLSPMIGDLIYTRTSSDRNIPYGTMRWIMLIFLILILGSRTYLVIKAFMQVEKETRIDFIMSNSNLRRIKSINRFQEWYVYHCIRVNSTWTERIGIQVFIDTYSYFIVEWIIWSSANLKMFIGLVLPYSTLVSVFVFVKHAPHTESNTIPLFFHWYFFLFVIIISLELLNKLAAFVCFIFWSIFVKPKLNNITIEEYWHQIINNR